jgi:hypothetical protein
MATLPGVPSCQQSFFPTEEKVSQLMLVIAEEVHNPMHSISIASELFNNITNKYLNNI